MYTLLTPTDFKLELKRGLSGGYLFCGPENYLAAHYCREARRLIAPSDRDDDFSCRRIDAPLSGDPIGELYDAVSSLSGFGGRRIVEVTGLDIDHLKQAEFDTLIDCCSMADETSILILRAPPDMLDVGYLPKRPSAKFTALAEVLRPVSFEYETPQKLAKWVTAHFAAKTLVCEPDVSAALIAKCGRDMATLSNEVDKIGAYTASQGRRHVTYDDIELLAVSSPETGAFDFSNAVTEGNTARALELLCDMKARKEKPELILASVTKVISDLAAVSALAHPSSSGASARNDEIAKKTKIHEFKVNIRPTVIFFKNMRIIFLKKLLLP